MKSRIVWFMITLLSSLFLNASQKLSYKKQIVRPNGKTETLNIRSKEALTETPFFYLIDHKEKEGRLLIIARVESKNDDTISYLDGTGLNSALFHSNYYPKYEDSMKFVIWKNPKTGEGIKQNIEYYSIGSRKDPAFTLLGTMADLTTNSPKKEEMELMFDAHLGYLTDKKTAKAWKKLSQKKEMHHDDAQEVKQLASLYKLMIFQGGNRVIRAQGLLRLAELYLKGATGFERNTVEAKKYFEQAAAQDVDLNVKGSALLHLGTMYFFGNAEIEQNNKRAKKYYEQAVIYDINPLDKAKAHLQLAHLYYYAGEGIERNIQKAHGYFCLASDQKADIGVAADANLHLGTMYFYKDLGIYQDIQEAKKYYELAAGQDAIKDIKALAKVQLGDMYRFGIGVEKDIIISKLYYQQSLELNVSSEIKKLAQLALGDIFRLGEGFYKNYRRAKGYYESALATNSCSGQHEAHIKAALGDLWRFGGYGIAKDSLKAKGYYQQALEFADAKTKKFIKKRLVELEEKQS